MNEPNSQPSPPKPRGRPKGSANKAPRKVKPPITGGAVKGSKRGPKPNLTPQQAQFVDLYCAGGISMRDAAIRVGVSPASAHTRSYKWTHDNPLVMAAITEYRAQCREKTGYRQQEAMGEADAAIAFAITTENANAYVKAVELKAKLAGLLDPQEGMKAAFQINILGVAAPESAQPKVIEIKEFSIWD